MQSKNIFIMILIAIIILAITILGILIWQQENKSSRVLPESKTTTNEMPTAKKTAETFDADQEFVITAKQWEFNPNTITVNEGDKVRLKITSTDVPHGFALPTFKINRRLEPGQEEIIEFIANKKGSFEFFCSVYCGAGHKNMRGTFIVE